MKSPKKYLDNYRLIGMRELLSNMIEEVQKDAYNQAIDDALNNTEYIDYDEHGQYDPQIDKDSILKLKIK